MVGSSKDTSPAPAGSPELVLSLSDWEPDKADPLYWQLRREFEAALRRQHWWWAHFCRGTLRSQRQLEAQRLSRAAERQGAGLIGAMGYQVHPTTHKAPFDLWVDDGQGRGVRVEVKISLYHDGHKGGRYQADVRHFDQADLLIFLARSPEETGQSQDWPFVIPMAQIAPRRNIAIWSICPVDYSGQWAPYLNAWQHLHQAIETARPPRAWQPALFMSEVSPNGDTGEA